MNIGLLGGSFDPAHSGHLHISKLVLTHFKLDQIWWLVTSQNPLKSKDQKRTLDIRLSSAKHINNNYKIKTQAVEMTLGTIYTYDTIKKLKTMLPRVNFIWIMGADNLLNMHKWHKWNKIFYLCPVVVVHRPNYLYKALSSKASKYFWHAKIDIKKITYKRKLPCWSFFYTKPNYISSTILRKNIG